MVAMQVTDEYMVYFPEAYPVLPDLQLSTLSAIN